MAIAPALETEGLTLRLSTSIGIAIAPAGGCDPNELLRRADAALYVVKARGRGSYEIDTCAD